MSSDWWLFCVIALVAVAASDFSLQQRRKQINSDEGNWKTDRERPEEPKKVLVRRTYNSGCRTRTGLHKKLRGGRREDEIGVDGGSGRAIGLHCSPYFTKGVVAQLANHPPSL